MIRSHGGVRPLEPPSDALGISTLARVDYADAFLLDTGGRPPGSPERWTRTILEDAPWWFRRSAPSAWRALGLERGPVSSPTSVLSWPIRRRTDDVLLLGASGRLGMSGELLIARHPDGLLFSTMIELRHRAARLEWAAITAAHQRIVASLLRRARPSLLAG